MVARGFVDIIRAGCASVRQIGGQHDREGAGYHLFASWPPSPSVPHHEKRHVNKLQQTAGIKPKNTSTK